MIEILCNDWRFRTYFAIPSLDIHQSCPTVALTSAHSHRSSRFSMLSRAPTVIETFPRSVVRLIALLAMKFHLSHREAPADTAASSQQPAYAKCPADYAMPCHTWVYHAPWYSGAQFVSTSCADFALLDPTGSKPIDTHALFLSLSVPLADIFSTASCFQFLRS